MDPFRRHSRTLLLLSLLAGTAGAATITVTTDEDPDIAEGFCSLREAILAANTDTARTECRAGRLVMAAPPRPAE